MFAKSVLEPIEDGGEQNERAERGRELVIASGDAAMAFDTTKEVFDAVTPAIKASDKGTLSTAFFSAWDAGATTDTGDLLTQPVRIEAFVSNQRATSQKDDLRFDGTDIVAWTNVKTQRDGSTETVNKRGELGVETSFGSPNRLSFRTSRGIGAVLVHFDVSGISKARRSSSAACKDRVNTLPQATAAPSSPP